MQLNVSVDVFIVPKSGIAFEGDDSTRTTSISNSNVIYHTSSIKDFQTSSGWDDISSSAEIVISRKNKSMNYVLTNDSTPPNPSNILQKFLKGINSNIFETEEGLNDVKTLSVSEIIYKYKKNNKNGELKVFNKTDVFGTPGGKQLVQRGDFIFIVSRYFTSVENQQTAIDSFVTTYNDKVVEQQLEQPRSQIFCGYITNVSANHEITLKCQDYMYFFQQLQIPNFKYLASKYTVNEIIEDMLSKAKDLQKLNKSSTKLYPIWSEYSGNASAPNTDIPVVKFDPTKDLRVGDITLENATIGMVFKELKNYMCCPYFYPCSNVLNISAFVYNDNRFSTDNPIGYQTHFFGFQKNIISSDLDYRKNSDLAVGAMIRSNFKQKGGFSETEVTAGGKNKRKTKQIQVFVGRPGGVIYTYPFTRTDATIPTDSSSYKSLIETMRVWGEEKLKKEVYDGYYGTFTVFGYPYVHHGDRVIIYDDMYKERSGLYNVKKVKYYGGSDKGLRQEITLHNKLAGYDDPGYKLEIDYFKSKGINLQ